MHTIWLTILFPLLGACLNGLVFRKASKTVSHLVGVLSMVGSFTCALITVLQNWGETSIVRGMDWLEAGDFVAPLQVIIDPLSQLMLLVVTGIGTLIHIYAGGYMHEEEKTYRFFTYLNLFVFMMLLLILGDNLLVMFVGWEGVGLCSYLLIGYWFDNDKNAAAGMKAFLANRIGDIGFLFGIFLTYKYFGTVSFSELKNLVGSTVLDDARLAAIGWITLSLFVGATGKSAQIPLYVWLPDAMAGPTPVSALIHAATMVTAGIYMMTRLNFMFYLAPGTMSIIATIGGLTALFAASIALVQNDIKKVLAYSTVSQLGYMVMACGVGAFSAGVFHLFTHACFKALLFLGAGSVIVAMHHEQDMRQMGGLRKYLPITHLVMLVGVLAIIGFPGLSGFFSKDEILWRAYTGKGLWLWGIGVAAAAMTSFYMVRLLCMTFYGPNRSDSHTREHLHETPFLMWAPLVVLALLSAGVGYLGVPHILGGHNLFEHFLEPVIFMPQVATPFWTHLHAEYPNSLEFTLMGASVAVMFIASSFAVILYGRGISKTADKMKHSFSRLHQILTNKWYVDELYEISFIKPLREISEFLWSFMDVLIVDGIVNGVAHFCKFVSGVVSFRMSGSFQRHAMFFAVGIVAFFVVLLF